MRSQVVPHRWGMTLPVATVALLVSCIVHHGVVRTSLPVLPVAKAPPAGWVTYFIGGDSRGDRGHVVPWAFAQARSLEQSRGFIFLGDMEWSHGCEPHFEGELASLRPVPFYPTLGNHEVRWFGWLKYKRRDEQRIEDEFISHFLTTQRITPGPTAGSSRAIFYSTDLWSAGGRKDLHFIALDNVSLPKGGFGADQIQWLAGDLQQARDAHKLIVVGMHKPFAGNCTGKHSMEEDGSSAIEESNRVLEMLAGTGDQAPINAVFVSHDHYFAHFDQAVNQRPIATYVTGGLGAHLKPCTCPDCADVHHVLQLDVGDPAAVGPPNALRVSVVKWAGQNETRFDDDRIDDDDDQDDGELLWDPKCAVRDPEALYRTAVRDAPGRAAGD